MTLVKCTPTRNLVPFSAAVNRVFDDFLPAFFRESEAPALNIRPDVDIVEEQDRIVLKADLPGMEKDQIKVIVDHGLLTIEARREDAREEKGRGYARSERFMGTFFRSFNLPAWADGSKIGADYKNGVLTVTIPKTESAKPKEVEIKVS